MLSTPTPARAMARSLPGFSRQSAVIFGCERTMAASRSEERRVGKECRSLCDWSSDVCSSDLDVIDADPGAGDGPELAGVLQAIGGDLRLRADDGSIEIGRASCRERV